MAYGSFYSQAVFSWTRELIDKDPTQALGANLVAVRWWPFGGHARLQLAVSFANLMARHPRCDGPADTDPAKVCLKVIDKAADQINSIAMSAAPYIPSVRLGRIEYLLFSGRDQERRQEIEDTLAWLKGHASLQATVWLVEAHWAAMREDAPRLVAAIRRGHAMAKDQEAHYRPQFEQLAALLTFKENDP